MPLHQMQCVPCQHKNWMSPDRSSSRVILGVKEGAGAGLRSGLGARERADLGVGAGARAGSRDRGIGKTWYQGQHCNGPKMLSDILLLIIMTYTPPPFPFLLGEKDNLCLV